MSDARRRLEYEVVRRKARGESNRSIARSLRIDPKTVARILKDNARRRDEGAPEPPPRAPRASKLDPYAGDIAALLEQYPDIRATRLLEHLEGLGFDGKYTIVRQYLKKLRPKAPPPEAVRREWGPGKTAQVDWAHLALEDRTKVYALLVTLMFSRHQYIELCTDMEQTTLFRVLRRAFEAQGGVADEYIFDSMPGIVDRWEDGKPVLNLQAMDFAAHYRFAYDIAPRRCPKYKASVERNVRGFRTGFLNARTLLDVKSSNAELWHWLDHTRNPSKHPRRSESRTELLALEALTPLPLHAYDTRELAWRLVDAYGYCRFDGNFYQAPKGRVGTWLCVRASETEVALYDTFANPLAAHPRSERGCGVYCPPNEAPQHSRRRIEELLAVFASWGQGPLAWAEEVRRRKRYTSVELARVVELRQQWRLDDLLAAITHAASYGAYDARQVKRILLAKATPCTRADRLSDRARAQIRASMAGTPVKQRDIAAYGRLLAGPGPKTTEAPVEGDDVRSEDSRGRGAADEDP